MVVIETDFQPIVAYPQPLVCCLGYFDGLHRGHQRLIQVAKQLGHPVALLTFDRHPKKDRPLHVLTPLSVKKALLESWGVSVLIIVQFTDEVMALSPTSFLEKLAAMNIHHLVVGEDFRFGQHALGDVMMLKQSSLFTTHVVETMVEKGEKISTSTILSLLGDGHVRDVTHLLGRPYQVKGYVGHGLKKGTELGYPTANIVLEEPFYLPKNGVYITAFLYKGIRYYSLASLGYHPTVAQLTTPSLEVHVLDFAEDLYEQHVAVEFLDYIRDEKKFASLPALIQQMDHDKMVALQRKKHLF